MNDPSPESDGPAPAWRPLTPRQRRVLGVLVEKAKTTDTYPLSLNALTTGCNQKSNRDPQMNLTGEQVEETLEELRDMGAVAEVQGDGRVPKYRHYAKDWFGIDKFELAVLTELLLRGQQTVGELRGRAARMEPIPDVATLRPILRSLIDKRLVVAVTPEGRGQVVNHGLFLADEPQPKAVAAAPAATAPVSAASPAPATAAPIPTAEPPRAEVTRDMFSELQVEVAELQAEVSRLKRQLEQLEDQIR